MTSPASLGWFRIIPRFLGCETQEEGQLRALIFSAAHPVAPPSCPTRDPEKAREANHLLAFTRFT